MIKYNGFIFYTIVKNHAGKRVSCLTSQSPYCAMVLDREEEEVEAVLLKEVEDEVEPPVRIRLGISRGIVNSCYQLELYIYIYIYNVVWPFFSTRI